MLTLVIALLSGQAAPAPAPSQAMPPPPAVGIDRLEIRRRDGTLTVVQAGRCAAILHRASPPSGAAPLLPPDDGRVRLYWLLDRRIDGCRVPLVAVDRLPDADRAIGRNLLRR